MSDNLAVSNTIYSNPFWNSFSPWVRGQIAEIQFVTGEILGRPVSFSHPKIYHHHDHHHYGWFDYWPSRRVVVCEPSCSDKSDKEDENEKKGSGVIAIFALAAAIGSLFFLGKFISRLGNYSEALRNHQNFRKALEGAYEGGRFTVRQKDQIQSLREASLLTTDLLKTKRNRAWINVALVASSIAAFSMIGYENYFSELSVATLGIYAFVPIGATAMFHWGRTWFNGSDERKALKIEALLKPVVNVSLFSRVAGIFENIFLYLFSFSQMGFKNKEKKLSVNT